MKTRSYFQLLISAILSLWLVNGCAEYAAKGDSGSKAGAEATAAITSAGSAIKAAKANNWIWRDTEKFLKKAQAAADKGDNGAAIKLANKAKLEAENAVIQYEFEKANPRGFPGR